MLVDPADLLYFLCFNELFCEQIVDNIDDSCLYTLQHLLHDGVRDGLPSQRGGETQEAADRSDGAGQPE